MPPSPYRKTKVKGRTVQMHRAIYEREVGPIPEGHPIHHKNENKRDNRPENLEPMTPLAHSRLHNNDVGTIRARVAAGERQCNLLDEYGISAAAMCRLVNRKSWTHVA